MQPIQQQFTGTGIATAIVPDIYQNPFRMSVGAQLLTGGLSTAIVSIEHSYDWNVVIAPSFNGKTAFLGVPGGGAVGTAAWFPNPTLATATITATVGTGSLTGVCAYTAPVAALRLNVISATATSIIIANFLQSAQAPS
jgi:hypothetical protein